MSFQAPAAEFRSIPTVVLRKWVVPALVGRPCAGGDSARVRRARLADLQRLGRVNRELRAIVLEYAPRIKDALESTPGVTRIPEALGERAALLGRVGSDRSTLKLHPSIFPWTTCRWAPSRAARFRLPSLRASSWARLSFVKFPELVVVTSLPALVWDYHEQLNH